MINIMMLEIASDYYTFFNTLNYASKWSTESYNYKFKIRLSPTT